MARITNPNIPAGLLPIVGPLLIHREGTRYQADSANLNPAHLRARAPAADTPGPFDLYGVANYLFPRAEPAFWRALGINRPADLADQIAARSWAPEIWTPITPYEDLIERATPGWIEDPERATDPLDPAEVKPTWCTYSATSGAWPYADLGVDPAVPTPGWETTIEAGNWIRDAWVAFRVLHLEMPLLRGGWDFYPLLGHLTGEIRTHSEIRAARSWYAPSVQLRFGADADFGFPSQRAEPGTHAHLVPRELALPEEAEPLEAAREIDMVVRMDVLSRSPMVPRRRFGRLTLSCMPTFGRYTAGNAWASAEADLSIALYAPNLMLR